MVDSASDGDARRRPMAGDSNSATDDKVLFSQLMRERTKEAHTLSDLLVNAKLGATCSNADIWYQGLRVFYTIFQTLESKLEESRDSLIGEFYIPGVMNRTEAFEKDLQFHFGPSWKDYQLKAEVVAYRSHIETLHKKDPYLVIPYIYHLYLGLLSGGQVLKEKRRLAAGFKEKVGLGGGQQKQEGEAVTDFGDRSISSIKRQIKDTLNGMECHLDEATKEDILKESVNVFKLNNTIINTIDGQALVLTKILSKYAFLLVLFLALCCKIWSLVFSA